MDKHWDRLGQIAVGAGLLDILITGVMRVVYGPSMQRTPISESSRQFAEKLAEITSVNRPLYLLMPVFAVCLVVVGVALLRRLPWARTAALLWSSSALIFLALMLAVQVEFVWPAVDDAVRAAVAAGAKGSSLLGYQAVKQSLLKVLLIRLPLPIAMLWLLGRGGAAAAKAEGAR